MTSYAVPPDNTIHIEVLVPLTAVDGTDIFTVIPGFSLTARDGSDLIARDGSVMTGENGGAGMTARDGTELTGRDGTALTGRDSAPMPTGSDYITVISEQNILAGDTDGYPQPVSRPQTDYRVKKPPPLIPTPYPWERDRAIRLQAIRAAVEKYTPPPTPVRPSQIRLQTKSRQQIMAELNERVNVAAYNKKAKDYV